jgi:hypothetical protein
MNQVVGHGGDYNPLRRGGSTYEASFEHSSIIFQQEVRSSKKRINSNNLMGIRHSLAIREEIASNKKIEKHRGLTLVWWKDGYYQEELWRKERSVS